MSRYRVEHVTGFKYQSMVSASYNEARMFAVRDDSQLVFSSKLEIVPKGSVHEYFDYFGTRTAMFEILEPHSEMTLTSTTLVEVRPRDGVSVTNLNWDAIAPRVSSDLALTDAVAQTRRTAPPAELVKFAKKKAAELSPNETAMEICRFVYDRVKYQHGVTGVHSVATEAWTKQIGVCQDFAHLVIGALRAVGLPARYVSGYLHPQLEPVIDETVVGESHAWVEWFSGDWFAFDPTNDVAIADRHIVVGRGRDYDDVAPLRGVYAGPFASELFVSVQITREV